MGKIMSIYLLFENLLYISFFSVVLGIKPEPLTYKISYIPSPSVVGLISVFLLYCSMALERYHCGSLIQIILH
jgi:hypothetical protein